MIGDIPETLNDDGLQTDNQEEESSNNAQYPMIIESDAVIRSAGPTNGRKPAPESKAAKISAFNNGPPGTDEANSKKYQGGGANMGGLVVSGIPMSQRTGAPIPNLTSVNAQYRKIPQTVAEEQPGDRISRTKTAKENKAIKQKLDAEYKQSIEGLSIVGTSANNKK